MLDYNTCLSVSTYQWAVDLAFTTECSLIVSGLSDIYQRRARRRKSLRLTNILEQTGIANADQLFRLVKQQDAFSKLKTNLQ